MPEYNREGTRDLYALTTAGAKVDPANGVGVTLASSTTYFFPLGDENASAPAQTSLNTIHLKWDAAVAATFTIETTCFPHKLGGLWAGKDDVANHDTAKGNWIEENPSTAYISTLSTDGTLGGATVTNATIVVAGGTAGGCMIHLGGIGSRRIRVKAVVTTGGVVRACFTGKNAA